ncbi:low temperature requirement protein A [Allokutzneria sp. A3M-2-11 16]|uniref:low temperature requirement protein A n=1 Tax=Allokutzneria sp. A3M-2-11 16 TaxID=2962043 RepID=UPI0020B6999B|nr:low temperature requirement protein A [Allokutzneria sp. A3M-2-11 16]MCP3804734.1 low temperature requirement protein A [Allokutzneria sp. A3M-2-11 16]
MTARGANEAHRAATPLELLFDLCFVVAVAQAAAGLHHAVVEHHAGQGVLGYAMVFFAIWWAWMNFTWFASAYDTDDTAYRVTTLVQIAGALVLAAGVGQALDHGDFTVITYGYVLMRLAMVTQWLRAAKADPERRRTALRYAAGITLVQIGWLVRLALPQQWLLPAFFVLLLAEIAVPALAERGATTPWHPGHIAERYGLFTLIVLGESILAATNAVRSAIDEGHGSVSLFGVAAAGLVIVFSLWWLYFDKPAEDLLTSLNASLRWGYGHLVIFASAGAVGAGLEVAVDLRTGADGVPEFAAGMATAVPVASYLLGVWALHVLPRGRSPLAIAFPVVAVLVAVSPLAGASLYVTAVLVGLLVLVGLPSPR